LADYVSVPGVYPAGRLDYTSEGLIVLTDSGWLQNAVSDPQHKLSKTYWVQVEGIPDDTALHKLTQGVAIQGKHTKPAQVQRMVAPAVWERVPPIRERKAIPTAWLALTITEGRNRQVRRMTAAVGHPTLRLIRWSVGPWTLDQLRPGEWRDIVAPRDRQAWQALVGQ
jgi:23S rRNA pseudouridine2457 synthase